jgi:P-type Cu+ transporter
VPAVLIMAAGTLTGWLLAGSSVQHALSASISVLIIACPCALGLATPTALLVASGTGAASGIFFKGYSAFERTRDVDTVVIDKTGTVTSGRMEMRALACAPGVTRTELLRLVGGLEQASEHLVGRAIAAGAAAEVGVLPAVETFVATAGSGVAGVVEGQMVTAGRPSHIGFDRAVPPTLQTACSDWESRGWTVVLVARNDCVIGVVAVADTVRSTASEAVCGLKDLGLRCILLSGDNLATVRAVGDEIGVSDVIAGALPSQKVDAIRQLQRQGRTVAMVGDGINDGPALAVADIGLAVGSGTDVAINAADLIVMRDELTIVVEAIALSRRTLKAIRGNLAWAFAYNIVAIPLAAVGLLNPVIAAGTMGLSSGFVIWNSARLRSFRAAAETHPEPTEPAPTF